MASSATRRRMRRDLARSAQQSRRENAPTVGQVLDVGSLEVPELTDSVWGYDVRSLRPGNHRNRFRVRWYVDVDPHSALMGLDAFRRNVLDGMEIALVAEAREDGCSWEDIGFALQMTGEGARKKHAAAIEALAS